MLLQVFFRLDVPLVVELGFGEFIAIDFYVSTAPPVAQHVA
jgi:hypothetical protein